MQKGFSVFDCGTYFTPSWPLRGLVFLRNIHSLVTLAHREESRFCSLTYKAVHTWNLCVCNLHLASSVPLSPTCPPQSQVPNCPLHTTTSAWSVTHSSAPGPLPGTLLLQVSAASVNFAWLLGIFRHAFASFLCCFVYGTIREVTARVHLSFHLRIFSIFTSAALLMSTVVSSFSWEGQV